MPVMSSSASADSAHPARRVDPALRLARDEPHHRGVAVDQLADAGPLHLDDDGLAGGQHRAVGLADGRGRERLPLEARERGLDGFAEGRLDDLPHLVGVDRSDAGLEPGELVGQCGGEQVRARRRDLTELHHHPAGVLDREPQAQREVRRVDRVGRAVTHVEQVVAAGVAGELAHAADRGERQARRPDGVEDPAPGSPPAPRAGRAGDDVEDDRDRHRDHHAQEEAHRDELPVAGVAVEHERGDDDPAEPAHHGHDGGAPASEVDAEHPRRHPADRRDPRDDHEDELEDSTRDVDRHGGPGPRRIVG